MTDDAAHDHHDGDHGGDGHDDGGEHDGDGGHDDHDRRHHDDGGDQHGHDEHDEHDDHDHHHHDADSIAVAIVTVSSSRTLDEDPSGDYIASAFEEAGHDVAVRELVPDEYDGVQGTVDRLARRTDTDAVITTGGTGVTPDDVTPEAVDPLFSKELPGFGELFRRLSYEEIGTKTIGSRAVAGVVAASPVFCLPGSENAARLGVGEVILPEIGHLVGLAGRDAEDEAAEEDAADEESDEQPADEDAEATSAEE